MVKKASLFVLILLLSTFIFVTLQIPSAKASGSILEEGKDGFQTGVGSIYTYLITYKNATPSYSWNPSYTAGDMIIINIIATNNSEIEEDWYADSIFGEFKFFNHTDNSTGKFYTVNQTLISAYNSTNATYISIYDGYYNFLTTGIFACYIPNFNSPLMIIAPKNWTAMNHTIANFSYWTFMFTTLPFSYNFPNTIEGTWIVQSGNYTDSHSYKLEFVFDENGICLENRMYYSGTDDWSLVYESILLPTPSLLEMWFWALMDRGIYEDNTSYIFYIILGIAIFCLIILIENIKIKSEGINKFRRKIKRIIKNALLS